MSPLLLTPGPLSTHPATRAAMDHDHGSRDPAFQAIDRACWAGIEAIVREEDPDGDWICVPVQGSGSFAVEAMLGGLARPDRPLLVLENGAYGERMARMRERAGRPLRRLRWSEEEAIDLAAVEAHLREEPGAGDVAVVHCETTTGRLNPLPALAALCSRHGRRLLVDSMSAFGALPLGAALPAIDAIAASANKCLEGVPGVAFVLVRRARLQSCEHRSPSLCLDLFDQWRRREADRQWRFTPPTHVIAALHTALALHRAEGGRAGRGARYAENARRLRQGMVELGFRPLLAEAEQAPIILTFQEPADPRWDFERVYALLVEHGFAIYPGKLTRRPSFRVGCIGQVGPADIDRFLLAMAAIRARLGFDPGATA